MENEMKIMNPVVFPQGTIFMNPNKDKEVKSTDILNALSKGFRNYPFKIRNGIKEGFELNPICFRWEYQIQWGEKLIVLQEWHSNTLELWAYKNGDTDIKPNLHYIFNNVRASDKTLFCKHIEGIFNKLK